MHDDPLKARLQALAEPEPALDEEARERVVAHIGTVGPKVVRRARRVRTVRRVGVSLAAVAAAVAGVWLVSPTNAPTGPACETWPPARARQLAGEQDLGVRGRLTSAPNTVGALRSKGGCQTEIMLSSGRVRVQADDLGGGELAVLTDEGTVAVHGTVFTVVRAPDATSIEVEQGRVSWTAPSKAPIYLVASESHVVQRIAKDAAAVLSPDPDKTAAVVQRDAPVSKKPKRRARRAKVAEKSEPSARETSVTLIQKAEAFRRDGKKAEAREAYRAAGAFSDGTAEAAWIALARYELQLGQASLARAALAERKQRFKSGMLALEAAWIAVRAAELEGDHDQAKALAQRLIEKWPNSPQATGAKAWLKKQR